MSRTIDDEYLRCENDDDLPALKAFIARTPVSEWMPHLTFSALAANYHELSVGGNAARPGSEPLEIRSYWSPFYVSPRGAPRGAFVRMCESGGTVIRNISDLKPIFRYLYNSCSANSKLAFALQRTKFLLNYYKNAIIIGNNEVRPLFRGHRTLPNMYKALYALLKVPYTPDTVCLLNPHPYELGTLQTAPLSMRKRLVRYYESFGFKNINPNCPFANLEIEQPDEDFRYVVPWMAHVPSPDTELAPEERKVLVDPFA